MPTNTPNYSLVKPTQEEFYNVDVQNNNMDTIDRLLKEFQDAITSNTTGQDLEKLSQALTTHLAERASLTKVGHTQLSNALDSTDETKAATPKAIKETNDKVDAQALNNREIIRNIEMLRINYSNF